MLTMLMSSHLLIVGLGTGSRSARPLSQSDKSHLHLSFAGQTYYYASPQAGIVTERGFTRLWSINLGAGRNGFLSIAICGDHTGTYPFGHEKSTQSGLSLLTYGFGESVYSSYPAATRCCGTPDGGTVHIEEVENNQRFGGTFTGLLTLRNGTTCPQPINGRFLFRQ